MKFSALASLAVLASTAYASSLTSGYDVVKARQHKIRRDVLDVCVGLDVDLTLLDIIQNGKALVAGHLDVCLCVSLIPDFIKVNAACQTAVNLIGVAKVTALLEGLINDHPDCQHCTFPAHSSSLCAPSWPCQFECQDGYSPYTNPGDEHPSACTCLPPNIECNGKCGSYPQGCGSAVPVPPKRRSNLNKRVAAPAPIAQPEPCYTHNDQANCLEADYSHNQGVPKKRQGPVQPVCPVGQTVCGVPGGAPGPNGESWECVDTQNDKESCGGCTTPFGTSTTPSGTDCTSIPNIDTSLSSAVSCRAGTCHVSACKAGFKVSPSGEGCMPFGVGPVKPPTPESNEKRMFNLGPGVHAIAGDKRMGLPTAENY